MRTLRGVWTVARRRGFSYVLYFLHSVLWPRAAYRYGWSTGASRWLRWCFDRVTATRGRHAAATELRRDHLLIEAADPTGGHATPDDIELVMDRAHAAGVVGVRDSFDTVVRLATGEVRFADLSAARIYPHGATRFLAERDRDRRAFNQTFDRDVFTEASVRRTLRTLKARVPLGYRDYAPIDFGGGVGIGRIASTDSGTGRWEFFNGRVVDRLVAGRRVLDLGSNNGSLPLMMLRAGAAEVVAIEQTPQLADLARFNARVLSWRDMRPYTLDVRTGDMRMFLDDDFGAFDVITAFCSLYYLPEADMARIIRKAADQGATLVIQANEAIDNLPARATQLHELMAQNGYTAIQMFSAPGFARPLLVGAQPGSASVLGQGMPIGSMSRDPRVGEPLPA